MGGRRGKGRNSLAVVEREKEGKGRLTGECAQLRFITGKSSWGLVSLGAVSPSTDGRRNTVPLSRSSFPFRDIRLFHPRTLSAPLALSAFGVARADRELPRGNLNTHNARKKPRKVFVDIDQIDPGFFRRKSRLWCGSGSARDIFARVPARNLAEPQRSHGNSAQSGERCRKGRKPFTPLRPPDYPATSSYIGQ